MKPGNELEAPKAWLTLGELLLVAFFLLSRLTLVLLLPSMISDVPLYAEYAVRYVDQAQTPYAPEFLVEYPPLSYWAIALPRIIESILSPPVTIDGPLLNVDPALSIRFSAGDVPA